ncbi:MAG TPA: hypothetical protein VFG83_14520, partial [Kofleriaceae bacterium]|nr:hypothetical protein [Kofleriaceae bacterium]
MTTAVLAAAPHPARAEAAHKDVATRASFHGVYLALGPVLAALHQPQGWDSAFGGELTVAWVDERRPLSAVGIEAGGVQLSLREAHRAWVDVLAATRIAGIAVGASVGVVADFDLVSPPRLGPQASLWVYAGVMP